jgi:hypothetical protein
VIFAISVCFFHFFVFFGCIFFAFFMCLIMKIFGVHVSSIFCVLFFYFLCTFFAFFASADRKSTCIRYRDNIGYPRYGESYNIGDNQYSSKNLSCCPINRFLESVTSLSPQPEVLAGKWRHHQSSVQLEASPFTIGSQSRITLNIIEPVGAI